MKKLFLAVTLMFAVVALSACTDLTKTQNLATAFEFESDEEVFAFSAVSTSSLLPDVLAEQPALTSQNGVSKLSAAATPPISMDKITPYLEMFEKLLDNNEGLEVTTVDSPNELFETMTSFVVHDLLGNAIVYELHYNTVLIGEDVEDNEQEYEITGILLVGTKEYQVIGSREVEEGEEEIMFKAFIDEDNYVRSTYEVEQGERSFTIETVENGILVSSSSIEVEIEDGEIEIELTHQEGDNISTFRFEMEVEDGQNILQIRYNTQVDGVTEEGDITVSVEVDPLTGAAAYQIIISSDDEDDEDYEYESERDIDDEDYDDEDEYETIPALTTNDALATLSFIAASLIDLNVISGSTATDPAQTLIEENLVKVNELFDTFSVFVDNGTDLFTNLVAESSDHVDFEYMLTININEEAIIIHYNVDSETAAIIGIILMGDAQYAINATNSLDSEQDRKEMVLTVTHLLDSVEVTYESEYDEDAKELEFDIVSVINEVETTLEVELRKSEDGFELDLDNGMDLEISKETINGQVVYEIDYELNSVEGEIEVTVLVDELGQVTHSFEIIEGQVEVVVEMDDPVRNSDDDVQDDMTEAPAN